MVPGWVIHKAALPREGGHDARGRPERLRRRQLAELELLAGRPDLARVEVSGVPRVINVGLLADDPPAPGEWVLIHVGFALSKIDEDEAAAALEFLEGIGQAYEDR